MEMIACLLILYLQGHSASAVFRPEQQDYVHETRGAKFLPPYYSNYGVYKQRNVALKCRVSAGEGDNVKFVWQKVNDDGDAQIIRDNKKYSMKNRYFNAYWNYVFLSKLLIRRTETNDSGYYRCRASVSTNNTDLVRYFYINVNHTIRKPIRLVSKSVEGNGLIQVLHKQHWGGLCDLGFTNIEATIACRSLGYVHGGSVRRFKFSKHFDSKKSRVWTRDINCPLHALDLSTCSGWGDFIGCNSWLNGPAIIVCRAKPLKVYNDMAVTLPGNLSEGIVQVTKNGFMGTVCADSIYGKEVDAICKMIGFGFGGYKYKPPASVWFRYISMKQILQNLTCPGDAYRLNDCTHAGWGKECEGCKCRNQHPLALKCWLPNEKVLPDGSIKLAASRYGYKGRVTIKNNGTWGSIDRWSIGYAEADMLCRMLGYRFGGKPLINQFDKGHGPVWIRNLKCPYEANSLNDCTYDWWNKVYYYDSQEYRRQDAEIQCRTQALKVPKTKFRLVGPKRHHGEGRLEYFAYGHWGTVCRPKLKSAEAKMFCSYLGFKNGGKITELYWWRYLSVDEKKDLGPSLIEYIDCPWNSSNLSQCSTREWSHAWYKESCSEHNFDTYLTCRSEQAEEYKIRLFGLNGTPNTGQLQVYYNDTWTDVCSINFDVQSVALICKQLGYRHGGEVTFSRKHDKKSWIHLDCDGKENNIGQCHIFEHSSYCGGNLYSNSVVIKCYTTVQAENITVSEESNGKISLHKNGRSFNICSSVWDEISANAACNMLYNTTGIATHFNIGFIRRLESEVNMFCPRGVKHLGDCFYGDIGYCRSVSTRTSSIWNVFLGGVKCTL